MKNSFKLYNLFLIALFSFPALCIAQSELLSEDDLLKKPIYTNLNKAFKEYSQVYRLRLKGSGGYYGKITAIHPKIDSLYNLQDFYVVNEALEDLPPSFGALQNLQFLYLSGNKFTDLPDTIYSFQYLKRLDIQRNQLTKISSKIDQLQNLEFFYINDNRNLKELPLDAIKKLKKLKYLNAKNTSIPRTVLEKIQEMLPRAQIEY